MPSAGEEKLGRLSTHPQELQLAKMAHISRKHVNSPQPHFSRGHVSLGSCGLFFFWLSGDGADRPSISCEANRLATAQTEGESAGETATGRQVVGEGGLDPLPVGLDVLLI